MMCEKAFEKPWLLLLEYAPNYFKTQEACDKAVRDDSSSLQFVLNWFLTSKGLDMWYNKYYDNDGNCWFTEGDDDDKFFKWYDGYKKRKAQRAKINKELLPMAWQPSRWWDWCVPEDEKGDAEKLWA